MPTPIRSKKKSATKPRKRKGKVVVKESVKVRPKGTKIGSAKASPIAPAKVYPENAVHFKVKIRKK